MKLGEISKSLALKLGDPVTSPASDGVIFTAENRKRYIERAYSRLVRTLRSVMRKYAPEFAKSTLHLRFNIEDELSKNGEEIEVTYNGEVVILDNIKELYVGIGEESGDAAIVKADYIIPENYLSVKYGRNSLYIPSTEQVYYTIINNRIKLLPVLYSSSLKYLWIDSVISGNFFSYKDDNQELLLSKDYIDMLITLAAMEGMEDLGRQDKYNLYATTFTSNVNILSGFTQLLETKEGSNLDE